MDFLEELEDAIDAEAMGAEAKALGILAEGIARVKEGLSEREALSRVPGDLAKVERIMSAAGKDAAKLAAAVESAVNEANDEWAAPFYEAAGAVQTGAAATLVAEAADEASKAVRAAFKSSVMGLADEEGKGFVPMARAYRETIADVAAAMVRGEDTGERAVRRAVSRLCAGGVRVVFESERTMELHSAVRMSVGDTFRRAMQDARTKMGEEFGADGVEVSAHGLCAPDHLPYQGRQFSKKEFDRIQAKLDRPIAEGYNCRHNVWPILLGVSKPALSEDDVDELARLSTEKVSFDTSAGRREMTRYEFTQYQRAMERRIRDARLKAYVAEKSTVGKAEADRRVRDMLRVYRTVSKQAGIDTRLERTKLYIPR